MTLTEQVQILNDKIKTNKAQYDLIEKQLKYLHYQVMNLENMNF